MTRLALTFRGDRGSRLASGRTAALDFFLNATLSHDLWRGVVHPVPVVRGVAAPHQETPEQTATAKEPDLPAGGRSERSDARVSVGSNDRDAWVLFRRERS